MPILQSTLITFRLNDSAAGHVVRACGVTLNSGFPSSPPATLNSTTRSSCPAAGTTEADGSTAVVVTPTSLNVIAVYIDDVFTGRTIVVTAGTLSVLLEPAAITVGETAVVRVQQPGGQPSGGARVLVRSGQTIVADLSADTQGTVTLSGLAAGTYTITGIRTGYDNGTATLNVASANPPAELVLRDFAAPTSAFVGRPVDVTVAVHNVGGQSGSGAVQFIVNNIQRGSQTVTLDPGGATVLISTFTPPIAGTYDVVLRLGSAVIGPLPVVVKAPTARFELDSFDLPVSVAAGEEVEASVIVRNQGDLAGNVTVALLVGAREQDFRSVPLPPGAAQTVRSKLTLPPGTHLVSFRLADGTETPVRALSVLAVPSATAAAPPLSSNQETLGAEVGPIDPEEGGMRGSTWLFVAGGVVVASAITYAVRGRRGNGADQVSSASTLPGPAAVPFDVGPLRRRFDEASAGITLRVADEFERLLARAVEGDASAQREAVRVCERVEAAMRARADAIARIARTSKQLEKLAQRLAEGDLDGRSYEVATQQLLRTLRSQEDELGRWANELYDDRFEKPV